MAGTAAKSVSIVSTHLYLEVMRQGTPERNLVPACIWNANEYQYSASFIVGCFFLK